MEGKGRGEESTEERVMSEEEKYEEPASSSTQNLLIGRRIPGLVVPLVKGLIVGKKGREDGSIDVTLILTPYVKKGAWVKAAVIVKNSLKLSKRSIDKYRYPLVWGSRLAIEAARNRGDSEWVRATVDDINTYMKERNKDKEVAEEETVEKRKTNEDKRKSDSSAESVDSKGEVKDVMYRSPRRRSRRISALRKWSRESSEKDQEIAKKSTDRRQKSRVGKNSIWGTNSRARRAARRAIRASSESQDSNQKGELDDKEVWESDEDDGMVFCPFTNKDIRRFIDVRESIKGKAVDEEKSDWDLHSIRTSPILGTERKIVRKRGLVE